MHYNGRREVYVGKANGLNRTDVKLRTIYPSGWLVARLVVKDFVP